MELNDLRSESTEAQSETIHAQSGLYVLAGVADICRMLTSQFLKWRIPTSRKWEQGRMLTFNFVGGRAYNLLYF
jgi:hypothetical protein